MDCRMRSDRMVQLSCPAKFTRLRWWTRALIGLLALAGAEATVAQAPYNDGSSAALVVKTIHEIEPGRLDPAQHGELVQDLVRLHSELLDRGASSDGAWANALAVVIDGVNRNAAPHVVSACLTHLKVLADSDLNKSGLAALPSGGGASDISADSGADNEISLADALTGTCMDPGGQVLFSKEHVYSCKSGGTTKTSGTCCTGIGCFFTGGFRCWRVANFCNKLSLEFNQGPPL